MKLEVTRNVVSDLWPLVRSREASADSRALVDAFLAEDASFATRLKESEMMNEAMPAIALSPEAERRMLDDARERARLKMMVIGGGIAVIGLLGVLSLVALLIWMGRVGF